MQPTIKPAGDHSVIVYIDEVPTEQSISQLKSLVSLISEALGQQLLDTIASYQSVLVVFDPMRTDHDTVTQHIYGILQQHNNYPPVHTSSRIVRLPVYYDHSVGPDLQRIADLHQCSIEDVVTRHCMNIYNVFAIGFAPGFAYLGHVEDDIATPRLEHPRSEVAAGSVAIADHQTAIYPKASPGGWNIIGRCPSPLFQPHSRQSLPFAVGDRIQFMPISQEEFLSLGGKLDDL